MALGFLFLIHWREEDASPELQGTAGMIAVVGACMTILSAIPVWSRYPVYAARNAELIPTVLVQNPAEVAQMSEELASRYPYDPLARLLHGTALLKLRDYSSAEEQARAGLGADENLAINYAPIVHTKLEMLLAVSLLGEGRRDDARTAAAPFCNTALTDPNLVNGHELFQQAGICN
jgi:hypothetical protein